MARIIRIENIASGPAGSLLNNSAYVIWSSVELSAGISCACLPVMPPLFQYLFNRVTTNQYRDNARCCPSHSNQSGKPLCQQDSLYFLDEDAAQHSPAPSTVHTGGSRARIGNGDVALRDVNS